MEIVFLLMGISFFIALAFVFGFMWANRNSQFSDLSLEAYKILDKEPNSEEKKWKEN